MLRPVTWLRHLDTSTSVKSSLNLRTRSKFPKDSDAGVHVAGMVADDEDQTAVEVVKCRDEAGLRVSAVIFQRP
jgi:hypothetical protein